MTGYWTDIVAIVAPGSAVAGDRINVVARVKNLGTYPFYIAVTALFDATQFPISPEYVSVGAGEIYSFSGSFIMPAQKITVWVYSWYWDGSQWVKDDQRYVEIALAELVAKFSEFAIADYRKV